MKNQPDWIEHALLEMARAMGEWLQANNDMNKPVHKLSGRELMGMSWAAMAVYTDLREVERRRLGVGLFDDQQLDAAGFVIRENAK